MQKLQNSALRIVLNAGRLTHIDDLHKEANILKLDTRRKHHVCHQVYKGVNNLSPPYISQKLMTADRVGGMLTRTSGKGHLKVKQTRLELCKKNFFHKGPRIWNPLENEIKSCNSLPTFKKHLYSSKEFT